VNRTGLSFLGLISLMLVGCGDPREETTAQSAFSPPPSQPVAQVAVSSPDVAVSDQPEPIENTIVASDLTEIPDQIAAELVKMGSQPNVGATQALYSNQFPPDIFSRLNIARNLSYGPAERNVLDVVAPAGRVRNRSVVVFIHGGGFGGGNKSANNSPFYDNIPYWVANNGMIGVNVNYRYAPASPWPAGIEDMRAIVAWIKANIEQYGGNPNDIFLWGKSTGASHVVDYMADVAKKGEPEQIAGAILNSGFYALGDEPAWENYYGSDVSLYPERNAIPNLVKSNTPIFASYAEFDAEMYRDQFYALLNAMNQAGRPIDALYLRGHSHFSESYAVGTSDDSLTKPILDFIRRSRTPDPVDNPVIISDLSAIPRDQQTALVQLGPTGGARQAAALYQSQFPQDMFANLRMNRDIAYGPAQRNVLDVVTPAEGGQLLPVVVFVHGGGFGAGNKSADNSPFYDNIPYWAASNGMIGVNINYRYAPESPWPAGIEDMRLVVDWLRRNIVSYGGDPDKIFLWGKSTGASHVADYMADIEKKRQSAVIAGAILTSGFYALGNEPAWTNYYGEDVSLYPERNALPWLTRTDTPILLTYAEFDADQYREQFNAVLRAMNQAGRKVDTLYLRGHSHLSETYAVGTRDTSLTGPVLDFVRKVTAR
jgi:acetyl esterase/lipase